MKSFLALAALAVASLAAAQTPPTDPATTPAAGDLAARGQQVQTKLREVNLFMQILPLTLKPDQIDALLTELEKIRTDYKAILQQEDEALVKLDEGLTKAVVAGREKGVYPPKQVLVDCYRLTRALATRRSIAGQEFGERLARIAREKCDEGQLAIMEKTLDPKLFDPSLKLEKRDDKIRFFCQIVFLDPLAYDVLKRERKRVLAGGSPAKEGGELTVPPPAGGTGGGGGGGRSR